MSGLQVVGVTGGGSAVVAFDLGHGDDPRIELAHRGWVVVGPWAATLEAAGDLRLEVGVAPWTGTAPEPRPPVPTDDGLVITDGEIAAVHQRVGSYAVVVHDGALLLTQLADHVAGVGGRWSLPGGGIDPGESPLEGVVREVWEETGQHIEDVRLIDLRSNHWVGRSPAGRLEDFHAVKLFHVARCPAPTDLVVHDVGGSTSRAAWVPLERVGEVPLAGSVAEHLDDWLAAVR
ncbi:NUDIX hydrolase [Janibacter sp. G56]|uniref:NUDIX hydrolase n=1 Tax=Janibacter sp. G56 TaxID=3418717 RepID=UPI003CFEC1F3